MSADAKSWKHVPFISGDPIAYRDRFSVEDYARIRRGLVPEVMEDKWFIFFDAPFLYLHRSWTGAPVYRVTIQPTESGAEVAEALCVSDPVAGEEGEYPARLLDFLIGNLLLDRNKPFPMPEADPDGAAGLLQHVIAGTGYPQTPQADATRGKRWFSWWRKR